MKKAIMKLFFVVVIALSVSCSTPSGYMIQGINNYNNGNYDQAILYFTKVIEEAPNSSEAYSNRAVSYAEKGNTDQAISDFNRAIDLDPKNAHAYKYRGLTYYYMIKIGTWGGEEILFPDSLGNLDKAIRDFETVLRLAPKDTDVKKALDHALKLKY
jgi:Flp pilus assembly protein TadD